MSIKVDFSENFKILAKSVQKIKKELTSNLHFLKLYSSIFLHFLKISIFRRSRKTFFSNKKILIKKIFSQKIQSSGFQKKFFSFFFPQILFHKTDSSTNKNILFSSIFYFLTSKIREKISQDSVSSHPSCMSVSIQNFIK